MMAEPLQIDDIANLPAILIGCIRARTWVTPEAPKLRMLARLLSRAAHQGIDVADALVVLAAHARADLPVPNTDWTIEMRAIERRLSSFLASPTGLAARTEKAYGAARTVDDALDVIGRWFSDERAKRAMDPADADRIIRGEVKRLAALHPRLGLSYGYIGNLWWGPFKDDRAFMVFTNLSSTGPRDCPNVSFGNHGHDRLGELAHMVLANLGRWTAEQQAKLDRGLLYAFPVAA